MVISRTFGLIFEHSKEYIDDEHRYKSFRIGSVIEYKQNTPREHISNREWSVEWVWQSHSKVHD